MFAGGHVRFHAPLTVGETVRRVAEVLSVSPKAGRSGALVIVDVRTRLFNASGGLAVEEVQNLVYREAATPSHGAPPDAPATAGPGVPLHRVSATEWSLRTDPALLMRFSAATANAHRIHYDWPYATAVEDYPDWWCTGRCRPSRLPRPTASPRALRSWSCTTGVALHSSAVTPPGFAPPPARPASCSNCSVRAGDSAEPNATLDVTTG